MKTTETLVWIIYDIVADKPRGRIAKLCKEAGLYRVQKSVFLGTIERNRLDELRLQVEEQIDSEAAHNTRLYAAMLNSLQQGLKRPSVEQLMADRYGCNAQ